MVFSLLSLLLFALLAFLCGSLPFGLWAARTRGIDIRTVGSGNIGFTNVWRCVGRKEGLLTLAGDVAKGAVATAFPLILSALAPALASRVMPGAAWELGAAVVCGVAAIAGHCFTPFAGFKGGKGVATSLGVFIVLCPVPMLATLIVFLLVLTTSRYMSAASVSGAVVLPLAYGALKGFDALFWVILAAAVLIVVRHRTNLQRIAQGTENRFKFSGKSGA